MQYTLKEIQAVARAEMLLSEMKSQGLVRHYELLGFQDRSLQVAVKPGMLSQPDGIGIRLDDQLYDLGITCHLIPQS